MPKTLTDADFLEETKKPGTLTDADFGGSEAPGLADSISTIQEQHPDIGLGERLIAKTFSNDPKSTLEYLKKNHPDLEFIRDKDQILIKGPNEKSYRVLDPNQSWGERIQHPWEALKEGAKDTLESAYDLGAGTASALAGGAAALTAAPETAGLGSLPASMAAQGAVGAGAEALRQKIGQELGIPQEVNYGDVAKSGTINGLAPLAFGSGATSSKLASALPNLSKEELEKVISRQSGIPGHAWDYLKEKLLPVVGEWASGANRETIRTLSDKLPQIQNLEENGITDFVDSAHRRLKGAIAERKVQAGKNLESAINGVQGGVDISSAKEPMRNLIAEMEAVENKTPALMEKLNEVKSEYNRIFGASGEDKIGPGFSLRTGQTDVTNPVEVASTTASKDPITGITTTSPVTNKATQLKEVVDPFTGQKKYLSSEEVVTGASKIGPERGNYSYIDPGTGKRISSQNEIPNAVPAQEAFRLQQDLADTADLASTKNGLLSRLVGKSPGDKRLAEAAREGYANLNNVLQQATENADNTLGSSGALKDEYKRLSQIQKTLNPYFKDPNTTYSTLSNLGRKNKQMLYEQLGKIDKEMGTNVLDDARLMEAYSTFSKPSLDPLSSGGVTSTSRSVPLSESAGDLGYYLGAGMGPGTGVAGRAIARQFGRLWGSPAAIRTMVEGNQKFVEPMRQYSPYLLMGLTDALSAKPRE